MAKQRFTFDPRAENLRKSRGQVFRGKMSSTVITPKGRRLREEVRERETRNWRDWI